MGWWLINDAIPILLLKDVDSVNVPYIWGARIFMLLIYVLIVLMVKKAWKKERT